MKVKDLIEVLKKQDKNAEVEMEIVCEEGHSIAYCINEIYSYADGEKNIVNLFFDKAQH